MRGIRRARRGVAAGKVVAPDQVLLSYQGLDGAPRRTRADLRSAAERARRNDASYRIELAPGEAKPIFLAVACNEPERAPGSVPAGDCSPRTANCARATRGMTTVETSNELFNEVLCRSAADLCMLMTDTPQGRYPYAGIPWYSTTFGRDGLITALQMLWCDPEHGARRVAPARRVSGQGERPDVGRRAGQDPA